jgi:hypothetical protein
LAVVAELFADLERGHIGDRESLALISAAFEYCAEHIVVLPGHSSDKHGDLTALGCGKRPFHRTLELLLELHQAGSPAQPGSFRIHLPLDFVRLSFQICKDRFLIDCLWHYSPRYG